MNCCCNFLCPRAARRRLAGVERGSRVSQVVLNPHCERVRATEHAPRGAFYVLEHRRGLAEIVARGARVGVERLRVKRPHLERVYISLAKNASRHGERFAQHRLGFFEAL